MGWFRFFVCLYAGSHEEKNLDKINFKNYNKFNGKIKQKYLFFSMEFIDVLDALF